MRRTISRTLSRTLVAAALSSLLGSPAFAARPRPHTDDAPAAAPAAKPEKVDKGPDANAKYRAKAEELKNQNKYDEAIAQYQNALVALPDDPQTLQDFGRTLYARGKFQDAVEKFKRLTQLAGDQPVVYYNLGYALRKSGDYAGAAEAYAKYVQMMPDDPDGIYGLAESLRAQQKFPEAAQAYDLYAQKETRPAEAAWVDKAKRKAQDIRAGGKGEVATTRSVSVMTISSNDTAPKTTVETVTSNPTFADRNQAQPVVAAATVPAAPVAAPAPATTVTVENTTTTTTVEKPVTTVAMAAPAPANNNGGLLASGGLTTNANGTVVAAAPAASPTVTTAVAAPITAPVTAPAPAEPAPQAAPPRPMFMANRDPAAAVGKIKEGDAFFTQKRFREALFSYQDAVKLDDQSVNALLKMGLAYANLNYFKEAIEKWSRVLELDPNNQYAKVYIERAKPRLAAAGGTTPADQPQPVGQGQGVPTTAAAAAPAAPVAATAQVSQADQEEAREIYKRAVALMGQTRFADAIAELTASIAKNPNFTNAFVARAGAYLGAKSYNEAVADYQKSLTMDPTLATPLYGMARAYEKLGDKAKACDYYHRYAGSNGRDAQPKLKDQANVAAQAVCQ